MAEKNSEKSFSYYLNEIANLAEFLKTYPDGSISRMALTISDNIAELKKALTGIRLMLLFMTAITIISVSICVFALSSAKFRSYFVVDNSALKDSLLNVSNNNTSLSYQTQKGKIITYNDLVKENELLSNKLDKVESDVRLLKSDLELCNLQLNSSETNLKYYKNSSEYYEGVKNKRENEDLKELNRTIDNIKKTDSGKILLKVFKDKMEYNPKTKTWTIDVNKK
jgi:hypothetical protein